jgi:hypothetical protein
MNMQFGAFDPDTALRLQEWLKSQVGCLLGRRAFQRGDFVIASVASRAELGVVIDMFYAAILCAQKVSCTILIEPQNELLRTLPASQVIGHLQQNYFSDFGDIGASYKLDFQLPCPVTNCNVIYSDFDQVAFYPQALKLDDDLYDPSMYCPWIAINVTSDVYAFSRMVADTSRKLFHRKPSELSKTEQTEVFSQSLEMFQRLAEGTINNYGQATDASRLCPIHLTTDRNHYIAQHDEAAFAEHIKRSHKNEMPVVYCKRAIEKWRSYFEGGPEPDLLDVYIPSVATEHS